MPATEPPKKPLEQEMKDLRLTQDLGRRRVPPPEEVSE